VRSDGRTGGRTDGRTDMRKLIVAFRNFAKTPKNSWGHKSISLCALSSRAGTVLLSRPEWVIPIRNF